MWSQVAPWRQMVPSGARWSHLADYGRASKTAVASTASSV